MVAAVRRYWWLILLIILVFGLYFYRGYSEISATPLLGYKFTSVGYKVGVSIPQGVGRIYYTFIDDDNVPDLVWIAVEPSGDKLTLSWCYVLSSGSSGCRSFTGFDNPSGYYIRGFVYTDVGRYVFLVYDSDKASNSGSLVYRYYHVAAYYIDLLNSSVLFHWYKNYSGYYKEYSSGGYVDKSYAFSYPRVGTAFFVPGSRLPYFFYYFRTVYEDEEDDSSYYDHLEVNAEVFYIVGSTVRHFTIAKVTNSLHNRYADYYSGGGLYPVSFASSYVRIMEPVVNIDYRNSRTSATIYWYVNSTRSSNSVSVGSVSGAPYIYLDRYCLGLDGSTVAYRFYNSSGRTYLWQYASHFGQSDKEEINDFVCLDWSHSDYTPYTESYDFLTRAHFLIYDDNSVSPFFVYPRGLYFDGKFYSCDYDYMSRYLECNVYRAPPVAVGYDLNVLAPVSYDENVYTAPVELNLRFVKVDLDAPFVVRVFVDDNEVYSGSSAHIEFNVYGYGEHNLEVNLEVNGFVYQSLSGTFRVYAKPYDVQLVYVVPEPGSVYLASVARDDLLESNQLTYHWFATLLDGNVRTYLNGPENMVWHFDANYPEANVCVTVIDDMNYAVTKCQLVNLSVPTKNVPEVIRGSPEVIRRHVLRLAYERVNSRPKSLSVVFVRYFVGVPIALVLLYFFLH